MTRSGSYDRVVLHIGRQKTGTSFLQRTLHNSEAVLAAAGVTYPQIGRAGAAHHHLARIFLAEESADAGERTRTANLTAELVAALAQAEGTWLFSSEVFQNVRDPARLAECFDPRRTDVIVYIREQYRFAQSAYAQSIHATRATETFEQYLERVTIHHAALLSRWTERFAPYRLIVRGYSRDSLIDGDIVEDFVVSADLPRVALIRRTNEQRPLAGGPLLELKRIVNGIADLPPEFERRTFRNLLLLAEREPDFRVKPAVAPAQVAAYRERFTEENAALVAAHPQLREALIAGPVEEVAQIPRRRGFRRVWKAIARQDRRLFDLLVDVIDTERPGEPPELPMLRRLRP